MKTTKQAFDWGVRQLKGNKSALRKLQKERFEVEVETSCDDRSEILSYILWNGCAGWKDASLQDCLRDMLFCKIGPTTLNIEEFANFTKNIYEIGECE